MTTDAVPTGGDPHRLLSDVRALAQRVRRDQRLTWVALLVLDRMLTPWGLIGLALLVLARLERNVWLLVFTVGYLALALLLPTDFGMGPPQWGIRMGFAVPQLIVGAALLLGAGGFAAARRRNR
jgi:hypothetical protein